MRRLGPATRARLRLLAAAGLTTAALATMAAVIAGCGWSGVSAGSAPRGSGASAGSTGRAFAPAPASPPASASSPAESTWPLVLPVPGVTARQHQTSVRPPAHSAVFRAEMTDLWAGVVSGRPHFAMPSFFPVVAYEQVKAIAYPAADWQNRLVAEFRADVIAAHNLIGSNARSATLVRVVVPEPQADWISPGACSNNVGYWHVAGARVVYRVGGHVRSFGIASLISWRGRWYVVHLGGELRTGTGGMVDQPAFGPGVPGPPGGC